MAGTDVVRNWLTQHEAVEKSLVEVHSYFDSNTISLPPSPLQLASVLITWKGESIGWQEKTDAQPATAELRRSFGNPHGHCQAPGKGE